MPIPAQQPPDDFTAAALRFYDDAVTLIAGQRWDGAVYMSGYVQECSLKARLARRLGQLAPAGTFKGKDFNHGLGELSAAEAALSAAATEHRPAALRAALAAGAVIDCHHPNRRYWPDHWTETDAGGALLHGRALLQELVVRDLLDHGRRLP